MATEIVEFTSYKMVIFHSFLYVYQRVIYIPSNTIPQISEQVVGGSNSDGSEAKKNAGRIMKNWPQQLIWIWSWFSRFGSDLPYVSICNPWCWYIYLPTSDWVDFGQNVGIHIPAPWLAYGQTSISEIPTSLVVIGHTFGSFHRFAISFSRFAIGCGRWISWSTHVKKH